MKTAKKLTRSDLKNNVINRILDRCVESNECLIWPGAKTRSGGSGYGVISIMSIKNKPVRACVHRLMWVHKNGTIPDEKIICHICDNPLCCNTDHMFIGTQKDNVRDMLQKKRNVESPCRGEAHIGSKMKTSEVLFIRENYTPRDNVLGMIALSKKYNVSYTTIYRIIKEERWAHV